MVSSTARTALNEYRVSYRKDKLYRGIIVYAENELFAVNLLGEPKNGYEYCGINYLGAAPRGEEARMVRIRDVDLNDSPGFNNYGGSITMESH